MIKLSKLNNNITFIHEFMPDVETVSIKIMVKTGSRNETIENNGISHFLEHMAFKGTKNRTAKQIACDFESIGADFNAYTSKEVTSYYSKTLKEYVEKSLEILVDMFENSIFDEKELERERGVILQELAMTNDTPDDIIFDYYQSVAFSNQAFGRSIIGTAENIKRFKKEDFLKYMEENYVSENIVLSVSGNIDYEKMEELANKYFSKNIDKKRKNIEKANYTAGFFKKEKDLEQVQCIIGFEGISFNDKNRFVMSVMNHILGSGMSSRLFQEVREKMGLCYSIYSFNDATFETGSFQIYTAVEPNKINQTINAIANELKRMINTVNDSEIERAKVKLKSSMLMGMENTNYRATVNAGNFVFHGKIETPKEVIDYINSVTISDVENMLKKIISTKPSLALYGKIAKSMSYDAFIYVMKS